MIKKHILLSLLSLTVGATLVLGNVVYATGNPAESHDETSPLRRVQEMQYGTVSYGSTADAGQCSECRKHQEVVTVEKQPVKKDIHHRHQVKKQQHKNYSAVK